MATRSTRVRQRVAEGVLGLAAVLTVGDGLWPGGDGNALWSGMAVFAVTAALVCASTTQRALSHPGGIPLVLGCTWLATYACVPETSDQMFHVAAMLAVLGVTEWSTRTVLPWWVHGGATAVMAWAGLYGSAGRETAIIGALFALWPLVLPAVVTTAVPRFVATPAWVRWGSVAMASIASLACARSGALGTSASFAVEDATVAAVASTAAALPLAMWAAQRTRSRTTDATSIAP